VIDEIGTRGRSGSVGLSSLMHDGIAKNLTMITSHLGLQEWVLSEDTLTWNGRLIDRLPRNSTSSIEAVR